VLLKKSMVINQNIKQIMEMDIFFSNIILRRRKESKKKYITTFSMLAQVWHERLQETQDI
jgi:hypothetical protein